MSIMPPFTYPNLSLCSHGFITVLCDLQMFLCPKNEEATCVHCAAALETGEKLLPQTLNLYFETSFGFKPFVFLIREPNLS
jgi:hypothetical protein